MDKCGSSRLGTARLFSRWFDHLSGRKHVVVIPPPIAAKYDREVDILHIDKCPPYPEQESEELGDDVIVRLHSLTGEMETLEVWLFPVLGGKRSDHRPLA